MKKIGCLTFHGSHNYGSSLQAYALKKYIEEHFPNYSYQIIDLRSDKQIDLYKTIFEKKDLKSLYSRLYAPRSKKALKEKKERYESFFKEYFNLSKRYSSYDELKKDNVDYDVLLCGSDQVWNVGAYDYDWSYFLDFKSSVKKISYACSMGSMKIDIDEEMSLRMKNALKEFSYISTRDKNTHDTIKSLGYESTICVDPTLLLTKKDWGKLISENHRDGVLKTPYILFYDLKRDKSLWKLAKKISKILKMPILITNLPFPRVISCSIGMKKDYASGPTDFLKYINNASLVLTSSFHGTVFSTLLNKPFFVLKSPTDQRIGDYLSKLDMLDRMVNDFDKDFIKSNWNKIDFSNSNKKIIELRKSSIDYLNKALEDK